MYHRFDKMLSLSIEKIKDFISKETKNQEGVLIELDREINYEHDNLVYLCLDKNGELLYGERYLRNGGLRQFPDYKGTDRFSLVPSFTEHILRSISKGEYKVVDTNASHGKIFFAKFLPRMRKFISDGKWTHEDFNEDDYSKMLDDDYVHMKKTLKNHFKRKEYGRVRVGGSPYERVKYVIELNAPVKVTAWVDRNYIVDFNVTSVVYDEYYGLMMMNVDREGRETLNIDYVSQNWYLNQADFKNLLEMLEQSKVNN